MITIKDKLSLGTLFRAFFGKIAITWGLTIFETLLLALLPLFIGKSIDGLLADDGHDFFILLIILFILLTVATVRRIYDTRCYGTMRVELSKALVKRC